MSRPDLLPKILEAWFDLEECEPSERPKLKVTFDQLISEALLEDDSVSRSELLAALKPKCREYRASRYAKASKVGIAP
jgi:hypothetical protein